MTNHCFRPAVMTTSQVRHYLSLPKSAGASDIYRVTGVKPFRKDARASFYRTDDFDRYLETGKASTGADAAMDRLKRGRQSTKTRH